MFSYMHRPPHMAAASAVTRGYNPKKLTHGASAPPLSTRRCESRVAGSSSRRLWSDIWVVRSFKGLQAYAWTWSRRPTFGPDHRLTGWGSQDPPTRARPPLPLDKRSSTCDIYIGKMPSGGGVISGKHCQKISPSIFLCDFHIQ